MCHACQCFKLCTICVDAICAITMDYNKQPTFLCVHYKSVTINQSTTDSEVFKKQPNDK